MCSPAGPSTYSSWSSPLPGPGAQPVSVSSPYCWPTQTSPTNNSPIHQSHPNESSPAPSNNSPVHQYQSSQQSPIYHTALPTASPISNYQVHTPTSPMPVYSAHYNHAHGDLSSSQVYHTSSTIHSPSAQIYQTPPIINSTYSGYASNWHHGDVGFYPNTYNYQTAEYIIPDSLYNQVDQSTYNQTSEINCVQDSDHKICLLDRSRTDPSIPSPNCSSESTKTQEQKYPSNQIDSEDNYKSSPRSNVSTT